jgi:hypothetical protein
MIEKSRLWKVQPKYHTKRGYVDEWEDENQYEKKKYAFEVLEVLH